MFGHTWQSSEEVSFVVVELAYVPSGHSSGASDLDLQYPFTQMIGSTDPSGQ